MELKLTKLEEDNKPCWTDGGEEQQMHFVVEGWTAGPENCPPEDETVSRVVVCRWWDTDENGKTGGNQCVTVEWWNEEGEYWVEDNRPVNALGDGDPNDYQLYEMDMVNGRNSEAALLELLQQLAEDGVVKAD